jgi:hypothetical protein
MISVSPSFAPVGKKLVFALNSMDLKNELKRAVGGDGEPIIAGAKPLAAYGVELPPEVLSVLVMDWGRMLSSLLETFKAFGQMVPPEQMPVDLRKLPKGDIFTEYLKPTLHYAKGGTDGMRRRNEASFGPETWFGIAAAIAGFAQHQTHRPPEGAAPGTGTDPKGSGGR